MEHYMFNRFTSENLVVRNNRRNQKKGTMNRSGGGITVCCPHQAAGRQLCISNTSPFLKPAPLFSSDSHLSRTEAGPPPARHTTARHMFSGAPSLRLSLIKYASLSADGKAVMSQIPLWVSCFCVATEAQLLSEVKRTVGFKWFIEGG